MEREAELLAYQLTNEVASGRHCVPSTKEAIKMAAIMAQLEFGDLGKVGGGEGERAEEKKLAAAREALLKFGPMKLTQMTLEHDQRSVLHTLYTLSLSLSLSYSHSLSHTHTHTHTHSLYQQRLIESWTGYAGVSRAQCARDFLQLALQWELCGATLFLAEVSLPFLPLCVSASVSVGLCLCLSVSVSVSVSPSPLSVSPHTLTHSLTLPLPPPNRRVEAEVYGWLFTRKGSLSSPPLPWSLSPATPGASWPPLAATETILFWW